MRVGMKTIRECKARVEIGLETLIWARGESFPLSMLEGRLKCPRCGSRRVVVLFGLLGQPVAKRA
jgi:DNA-directed RNA polymerase subunit RPC12/RpoP